MPTTATSSAGNYLSASDGSLSFSQDATYKLSIAAGPAETATTTFDEVFDLTLTPAQTVSILNAFTTTGVLRIYPQDVITATNSFALGDAAALDVLKTVIETAASASSKTAEQYLKGLLDAWIMSNISTVNGSAEFNLAVASNVESYPTDKLTMAIDASSGNVVIDAVTSAASAASACLAGDANIVKQIPYATVVKYQTTTEAEDNTIDTTALPLVSGDKLLFVLVAPSQSVSMAPSDSSEPAEDEAMNTNPLEDAELGAAFTSAQTTPSKRLAFRMTMGGTAGEKIVGLKA
jgi:hypothetical protein